MSMCIKTTLELQLNEIFILQGIYIAGLNQGWFEAFEFKA